MKIPKSLTITGKSSKASRGKLRIKSKKAGTLGFDEVARNLNKIGVKVKRDNKGENSIIGGKVVKHDI